MDFEEHRAESRDRWESAAGGWDRRGEAFSRATLPVAHRMVDAIAPQPGQTVLELAAGPGDVGFLAAELLHPGGTLISTDGAEAMVEVAKRRGEERGVRGAEFRPMELEWIDQPTATVDAILSRFGHMHAVDPEAALREARRVLRPGGRLAMAVWDAAERNPWLAVVGEEAARLGGPALAGPGEPGAFALSATGTLADLLYTAGFDEVVVEPVDVTFEAASLEEWWDTLRDLSSTLRPVLEQLSPADMYRLRDAVDARWSAHARDDGTVAIPGRALVAAASA